MNRRGSKKIIFAAVRHAAPFSFAFIRDIGSIREQNGAKKKAFMDPSIKYRMIMVNCHGSNIWAPKTASYDQEMDSVTFRTAQVVVKRTLTIRKIKLVDPDGYVIGEQEKLLVCYKEDTLQLSYAIGIV